MSRSRAAFYLQIPADYCRTFGGMRWAQYGEAVEFLDGPAAGRTFAFAAEIALFLEGMCESRRILPDFGLVLHLLYLVGLGDRATRHGEGGSSCIERVAAPFRDLGCPLRNAGALASWLSRKAPPAADPPALAELHAILTGGSWVPQIILSHPSLGVFDQAEKPSLDPNAFEKLVWRQSDSLSNRAIRHWLRHGRGPSDEPGESMTVPVRPTSLTESLAEIEERPRLAGISRLMNRMDAVLTLPARRLRAAEPHHNGGYADLATRGIPERILPFQFALDADEFLRRYAEHELLYFQREESRQHTVDELILLVDQGVRTWGDVRLWLAGAVLALLRQAGSP